MTLFCASSKAAISAMVNRRSLVHQFASSSYEFHPSPSFRWEFV